MTDEQVTANLRPHGSVKVLHPLRGSEDDLVLTESQRDTLRWIKDAHDEVSERLRPDGVLMVETVDYQDGDVRVFGSHQIGRDGIPL